MKKIFDQFTNLYSFEKTLQFELIPLTDDEYIKKLIRSDFDIQNIIIPKFKKLFDKFFEKLIDEILQYLKGYPFDVKKTYLDIFEKKDWLTWNKELRDILENYQEKINEYFKSLNLNNGSQFLENENELFKLFQLKNEKDLLDCLNSLKGKFMLIKDFLLTRENILDYHKGKSNSLIYRLINDNLVIFIRNLIILRKLEKNITYLNNAKFLNNFNYDFFTIDDINLYNQNVSELNSYLNKESQKTGKKYKLLSKLKKIHLYEKIIIKKIENEDQLLQEIEEVVNSMKFLINVENPFSLILDFINDKKLNSDIYLNRKFINLISKKIFNNYGVIFKDIKLKDKNFAENNIVNFNHLLSYVKEKNKEKLLIDYFKQLKIELNQLKDEIQEIILNLEKNNFHFEKKLLEKYFDKFKQLKQQIALFFPKKIFDYEKENLPFNGLFYEKYSVIFEEDLLRKIENSYNLVRNYVTKKPEKKEKININFNVSSLLTGWDRNKIFDYRGLIFIELNQQKNFYYIAIILDTEAVKKILDEAKLERDSRFYFLDYRQLPDVKKDLPRLSFSKKNREILKITDAEIKAKKIYDSWKKNKDVNNYPRKEALILINLYKKLMITKKYNEDFDIDDILKKEYQTVEEFLEELSQKTYKVRYVPVDFDLIKKASDNKQIILFKIKNKDFIKKTNSKDDLFTLYLENTINPHYSNLPHSLRGGSKIFFRPLGKKTLKEKRGNVEVISGKRFTKDKYFIHLTIGINGNSKTYNLNNQSKFNIFFYQKISSNKKEINFLGVDRGENNLIYISLINQYKQIILQKSLNKIKLGNKLVDFNQLLTEREQQKKINQKHWLDEVIIKNLKKSYLGFAVREIANIAYENNALIILENLDLTFMKSRTSILKNIYQNFEVALTKKLNYLVFKEKLVTDIGSPKLGIQLTPLFTNYHQLKKPLAGAVIFVPADFTSNIDPLTGFHKYLKFDFNQRNYFKFLEGLELNYDKKEDIFYLNLDTSKIKSFINRQNYLPEHLLKKVWQLRSNILRSTGGKNSEIFLITEKLKNFFADTDYSSFQMKNKLKTNFTAFQTFVNEILKFWLNLRVKNDKMDDIISPVSEFDTTKKIKGLPESADANGAYCIALKGLVLFKNFIIKGKYEVEIKKENLEKEFLQLISSK